MEKLDYALGRAEKYRLLGKNHPEGLRVHIEYIADLVKTLVSSGVEPASAGDEKNELIKVAMKTVKNLQEGLDAGEEITSAATSNLRTRLQKSDQSLVSFDGEPDQFYRFMDGWEKGLFGDHSDLNDIEKLFLLKQCLKGVTFEMVDVLPMSARNYLVAWKLLKHVYWNPNKQISKLYHSLVALPQVSIRDAAKFRHTFDELEKIIMDLMKAGDENDLCLRLLYLRKFSEETLISVLVEVSGMSLSSIREKLRHVAYVQALDRQLAINPEELVNRKITINLPESVTNTPLSTTSEIFDGNRLDEYSSINFDAQI